MMQTLRRHFHLMSLFHYLVPFGLDMTLFKITAPKPVQNIKLHSLQCINLQGHVPEHHGLSPSTMQSAGAYFPT